VHGVIVFTSDIIVVWATKVCLLKEGFIYPCVYDNWVPAQTENETNSMMDQVRNQFQPQHVS